MRLSHQRSSSKAVQLCRAQEHVDIYLFECRQQVLLQSWGSSWSEIRLVRESESPARFCVGVCCPLGKTHEAGAALGFALCPGCGRHSLPVWVNAVRFCDCSHLPGSTLTTSLSSFRGIEMRVKSLCPLPRLTSPESLSLDSVPACVQR